ncbi:MAG: exosortase/archaeosortase family protein [Armatimonadetes bacterium]|nr:exosortase/archaeosortase family protein [Armatimonadota bacterium]
MSTEGVKSTRATGVERLWIAAIIAAAVILYIPTLKFFWIKWQEDSQYSLAPLVPFVTGYYLWKKWPEAAALGRSGCAWGLALIVLALVFHLAGVALDVTGPSGISLYMCLLGLCLYLHGPMLVRTFAFPLAYTLFAMPLPGGILDLVGSPLQLFASRGTAALLHLMHINVVRDGITLAIDGYTYNVAPACSGLSSLVALIGVTAVFAYSVTLPTNYKWTMFFLAVPIALAANIVRITTIGLVGVQWGPDVAMEMFHDWSSPILFLAAIVILLIINRGFEWLSDRRTTS